MEVWEKKKEVGGAGLFLLKTDEEEEVERVDDKRWRHGSSVPVLTGLTFFLLGELAMGVEGTEGTGMPAGQSPGPVDLWECTKLLLHSTLTRGGYGLAVGAGTVAAVWVAEVLSASRGLVAAVWRVPWLGLLTGAGAGAADGLGRLAVHLGPGVLWESARGGVMGIWVGVKVAAVGGTIVGAVMCGMSAIALRNLVRGGDLRVIPLVTVSATLGASSLVVSWAPETMAMGSFVGAILGSAQDPAVLKTLGLFTVGGFLGVEGQKGLFADPSAGAHWVPTLTGGLVGFGGAGFLAAILRFPLKLFPALVSVSVGATMAFMAWRVGDALCHSAAEVMEKLFGAISINAHYRQSESEG